MNRLHINLKQFSQIILMLFSGLLFVIYLNIQTSKKYTQSYIPDSKQLEIEKEKGKNLEIELAQAKERYKWKIDHPIPVQHTGLKNIWYDRYGIEKDVERNKYGVKINNGKKVENTSTGLTPVGNIQVKKQQKMIRYEDWIDEVDTPQVKPIDPDPIILQKEEMIKEANEQN